MTARVLNPAALCRTAFAVCLLLAGGMLSSTASASTVNEARPMTPCFTQLNGPSGGAANSQDFGSIPAQAALDNLAADHFQTTAACKALSITVLGHYVGGSGAPSSMVVTFYQANNGLNPGTVLAVRSVPAGQFTDNAGTMVISWPNSVGLPHNQQFYVSVQAVMSSRLGRWVWDTTSGGQGFPWAMWESYGGGGNPYCPTWTPIMWHPWWPYPCVDNDTSLMFEIDQ